MAAMLEAAVKDLPGLSVAYPRQANAVFVKLPKAVIAPLQAETFFWPWDEAEGIVRWMCAFDTEPSDIETFAAQAEACLIRS